MKLPKTIFSKLSTAGKKKVRNSNKRGGKMVKLSKADYDKLTPKWKKSVSRAVKRRK